MSWPEWTWYEHNVGKDVWMVCRNGHLWLTECPFPYQLANASIFDSAQVTREVVKRASECAMCRVIKQAGRPGLRGIRAVHPDFYGITHARKLLDGTIEHHRPEEVALLFKPERVRNWQAIRALASLSYGRK